MNQQTATILIRYEVNKGDLYSVLSFATFDVGGSSEERMGGWVGGWVGGATVSFFTKIVERRSLVARLILIISLQLQGIHLENIQVDLGQLIHVADIK